MIQFTDEQMRKLIKEETEQFLDSPYDASFDLVLNELQTALPRTDRLAQERAAEEETKAALAAAKAKAAAGGGGKGGGTVGAGGGPSTPDDEPLPNVLPTWRQKLDKATAATKKGFGQAAAAVKPGLDKFRASDINQKGGEAILDLGKRTASGIAKAGIGTAGAIGTGIGSALGGLAKGAMGAFQAKTPMQKLTKASKKAQKAGIDKDTILQLAKLYQSGALSEKQIATLKLMERCLKSGKVRIIKENKKPIIIDV
tara:strand:- start:1561 stop:2328 length:768 start_codon:yes stop_codon:yes gene_type:complete